MNLIDKFNMILRLGVRLILFLFFFLSFRFLRPIITFPIMFAIVGVAFSFVVGSGSITLERQTRSLDAELVAAPQSSLRTQTSDVGI